MSSGSITITAGYAFNDAAGERIDLTKLNRLGVPIARVDAGSITRRELQTAITEQLDGVSAGLATEITVRAAADEALVSSITTLTATVTGNYATLSASITSEATARATADSALSTRIDSIVAAGEGDFGAIEARITAIESAYVETAELAAETSARTAADSTLSTAIGTVSGNLTSEASTRASADSALSARATTLEAQVAGTSGSGLKSLVTAEESARVSADGALSTRVSAVESTLNTPSTGLLARVSAVESTAITAAGASAIASSVVSASLSSTAAGAIGAAVSDVASASVTRDGYLAGMRVLSVDAGGNIAGVKISAISDPSGWLSFSEISFLADSFKFYTAGGRVQPFSISGSAVVANTRIDVNTGPNRIQITGDSLRVGAGGYCPLELYSTGSGGDQGNLSIAGSYPVLLAGGAVNAFLRLGAGSAAVVLSENLKGLQVYGDTELRRQSAGIWRASSMIVDAFTAEQSAVVKGDIFLGIDGTERWIYDCYGQRILRPRYTTACPAGGAGTFDAMAEWCRDVLIHHGLGRN